MYDARLLVDRIQSLPPVIAPGAKLLILGTMPGRESLARQQYYGHGRNAFWRIMEPWSGEPGTPYEQRCARLESARIALWDVLHECERGGSADSAIVNPKPNDLAGLLDERPTIRHFLFNGQKARALYDRLIAASVPPGRVELVTMPSTSPANARAGKVAAWRSELARFLA